MRAKQRQGVRRAADQKKTFVMILEEHLRVFKRDGFHFEHFDAVLDLDLAVGASVNVGAGIGRIGQNASYCRVLGQSPLD